MCRPRVYCVVYACLNSSTLKPELSFFKLPSDVERRSKWLRLISREDLVDKPPQNYTVCEEHFDTLDILPGTYRKKLKKNSLPCLFLPGLQKKDVHTLTEAPMLVEKCIQTEEAMTVLSSSTQTLGSLSLQKTKLQPNRLKCPKKKKIEVIDNKTGKYQRYIFHKLCDKFLTKDLAQLVKTQTIP